MWTRIKSFLFENKTTKQTIAKNTVWLTISNFGGRIFKAAIVIYAARVLGTAGYGVFSYAVTLAGFFTFFADPGINSVLIREGAKANPEERRSLFSASFILKIFFIGIGVLLVLFVAPFFSTLPGAKILLPLIALMIVFDSLREFFSSFFRAQEKMQWDAAAFIAANLSIAILGLLFLRLAPTPFSISWAYAIGTAIGALVSIWFLRYNAKDLFARISWNRIKSIIATAWPFAIVSALGILLTNTDILIISWMKNASDVGIYSAAIRIIQVLYVVPGIIQLSTLPALARAANKDNDAFRRGLERTLGLIFLVSIPLSFGGAILGTPIMRLVFGSPYAIGGIAFSILMLGIFFDYTTGIVSNAIFAYDHQKSLIISSAIGGVSNIVFDLLLIPHWGIAGSAVATLCAQILSNSYLWHAMKKINHFSIMPRTKKIFAAGIIMAAATAIFAHLGMNVLANIILSGGIYFALLFAFRESLIAEMKRIVLAKI